MRDETKCLHAGYTPKNGEPRVLPIVQSTTYVYDSAAEVAAIFDDPTKGLCYSRFGNPTVMAVEEKIAALEGKDITAETQPPVFFQKIHKNPHFCAQILPYKEERLLCRQKAHTGS